MKATRQQSLAPLRRVVRWSVALATLALMPKCVACLAAYLALGVGSGALGLEFCGPSGDGGSLLAMITSSGWVFGWSALMVGAGAVLLVRRDRRRCGELTAATRRGQLLDRE